MKKWILLILISTVVACTRDSMNGCREMCVPHGVKEFGYESSGSNPKCICNGLDDVCKKVQ